MPRENKINEGTKALLQSGDSSHKDISSGGSQLFGRVVAIVLIENSELFKKYKVLETIEFEPILDISSYTESGKSSLTFLSAIKLDSTIKTPVINEVVPIYIAPDLLVQQIDNQFSKSFYYGNPIALYASVEHNAAPDQNTIENLIPGSSTQQTYNNSILGILQTNQSSDTIISRNKIKLGDYFQERGIKPLTPLEGDHKIEGRFGNSYRQAGTPSEDITKNLLWKGPIGSPITIIRNGQKQIDNKANWNSVTEDINKDGGSIYMLSDQKISVVISNDNFDSYNQTNQNTSNNVIVGTQAPQTNSSSAVISDNVKPVDIPVPPVNPTSVQATTAPPVSDDLSNVPDNESDLNFVTIGEDIDVPITNGLLLTPELQGLPSDKYTGGGNSFSSNSMITPGRGKDLERSSNIMLNAGRVSRVPGINNQGRALVDLIALTEGTMGQGNFNGYDVVFGYSMIKNFTSWDSSPLHPNPKFIYQGRPTSASGRYQAQVGTWAGVIGSTMGMSKFNQDYFCWKDITVKRNQSVDLIGQMDSNKQVFEQIINNLADEWASLPRIKNNKSEWTMDNLYQNYLKIFNIYKGQ